MPGPSQADLRSGAKITERLPSHFQLILALKHALQLPNLSIYRLSLYCYAVPFKPCNFKKCQLQLNLQALIGFSTLNNCDLGVISNVLFYPNSHVCPKVYCIRGMTHDTKAYDSKCIINHLSVYTRFSNPNRCWCCSPPGLAVISAMALADLFVYGPPRLNSELLEGSSRFSLKSIPTRR